MMISTAIIFILFIILILIICFIICNFIKSNTKYGGTDHTNKKYETEGQRASGLTMTFTISGEDNGLDFSQLRQLFKEASIKYNISFKEAPVTEKAHISFGTFKNNAVVKGEVKRWNYDPLFFKQNTAIKNTLGEHHQLINKSELYDTIKRLIPNGIKYLPKCYNSQELTQAFNEGTIKFPLIIKKDNVPQQQAIQIILSKEEYYKAIKDLDIKAKKLGVKTNKYNDNWDLMASEYITNPLLIDGKKFHLRVYFLLSVISGITRCIFYRQYRILTAKNLYIKEDWLNRDIHLSGGHNTEKRYNLQKEYPDHFHTIEKNLNKCNKIICMAMTMANVKNYPESYAGYHIYGADIMLTDSYHPYLLEINSKPGYSEYGENLGWEEYNKQFSYNLFSFILNSTVFPTLGISSAFVYDAEFIGEGALTPYAHILTGHNKYFFIPYLDANKSEINNAEHIHFFNKGVLFNSMIKECDSHNIFLIRNASIVIGYLVLTRENNIKLAIKEEFQNREIGTAMIAQFIEIYFLRHFAQSKIAPLYILHNNKFMIAIAKKLQFEKHKNVFVKYNRDAAKSTKLHNQPHLTYKLVYEETSQLEPIFSELNKYMAKSDSQFVSFVYNKLNQNSLNVKHSTGSRYDKNFIYQGAELKSSLDIKILFNSYTLKKYIYDTNNTPIYFFDKKVNVLENGKTYIAHNYKQSYNEVITTNEGITNNEEYLLEEYHTPYLLNDKLMGLRCPILIYALNCGVIKLFIFSKKIILTATSKYDINDINNNDVILLKYSNTTQKTLSEIKELKHITNDHLNLIIKDLFILLLPNIKLYPENNSGFLECIIDFKFIKNTNGHYQPIIHRVFNYNILVDSEYYKWVSACVILPHFGLASHKHTIPPNYGALSTYVHYTSKKIQYFIIENIHLEFNLGQTNFVVYYGGLNAGHIKLHIKQNEIYVTNIPIIKEENIEINIIFILMEILRAYYAPVQMFLLLKYEKKMDDIAFELEFSKKGDYYIKKC